MDKDLVSKLEIVLTIDGRGRPAKAKLLVELIKEFGSEFILNELEIISKRVFI